MVVLVSRISILVLGLGLCCFCVDASGAQIWLGGVDPVVRATSGTHTDADYEELFQPGAPWGNAARSVQVFKTSTRFLANASDDALVRMFADLKRRNIALGAETLMLTTICKCGAEIEGYSSPHAVEMVASRVQRLGENLRYVAMDEPLDFGHYSNLPNARHSSVADIASDVAG